MRMEELSENRYIKSTDTVERYLLELVRRYFDNANIASELSQEYIIKKALTRMKEEISFDGIGVTKIIIDGEEYTGAVNLSLEMLGGEPLISPKHSAFNVDFGTEAMTACEGNDPRLFNARTPLPHKHGISDVAGLEGILSTLTGKIERVNGLMHQHPNKSILDMLIYTGDKSQIDLTLLDTLEEKTNDLVNTIRSEVSQYRIDIDEKIKNVQINTDRLENKIKEFKESIRQRNAENLLEAKNYADGKDLELKEEFDNAIADFIKKDDLEPLLDVMQESIILIGIEEISLHEIIDVTTMDIVKSGTFTVSQEIQQRIMDNGLSLNECHKELSIKLIAAGTGKATYAPIPYITVNGGNIDGILQGTFDGMTASITLTTPTGYVNGALYNASIVCKIYHKQGVVTL